MVSQNSVPSVPSTHIYLTPRATRSLDSLGVKSQRGGGDGYVSMIDLREISRAAAAAAADLVRHMRGELADSSGRVAARAHKSSEVDPVTAVDVASEKFLQHFLLSALPGSTILGEEEGHIASERELANSGTWDTGHPALSVSRAVVSDLGGANAGVESVRTTDVVWVVDPIDGTVNFMYGQPDCAVSVAATVSGVPIAAAVVQIPSGKEYCAHVGGPATLNANTTIASQAHASHQPRTLEAPGAGSLAMTLVATGFGYVAEQRRAQARVLSELLPQVRDIRRAGSAALDLCHLAEGTVDAYYEHGLGPWDYVAGALIAARAGVDVIFPALDSDKEQKLLVAGSSAHLLPELIGALAKVGAGVALASK